MKIHLKRKQNIFFSENCFNNDNHNEEQLFNNYCTKIYKKIDKISVEQKNIFKDKMENIKKSNSYKKFILSMYKKLNNKSKDWEYKKFINS